MRPNFEFLNIIVYGLISCTYIITCVTSELTTYRVYQLKHESDQQREMILDLYHSEFPLYILNGVDDTSSKTMDVLVTPDFEESFIKLMTAKNIPVKEFHSCNPLTINKTINTYSDIVPKSTPVVNVPGTSLFTGIYYTVGLLKYPRGFVTWEDKKANAGNKLKIDFPKSSERWWDNVDNHWIILPASEANDHYLLVNRGDWSGVFTYTNDNSPDGNYLQLSTIKHDRDNYKPGGRWRQDCLIRIIPTELEDHYLLKIKGLPHGVLTWTRHGSDDSGILLQIDTSDKSPLYYQQGQYYREDVLFRFQPLEQLVETIVN